MLGKLYQTWRTIHLSILNENFSIEVLLLLRLRCEHRVRSIWSLLGVERFCFSFFIFISHQYTWCMSYEVAYAIQIPRCKMQIQVQDQIESNYQLILFFAVQNNVKKSPIHYYLNGNHHKQFKSTTKLRHSVNRCSDHAVTVKWIQCSS